MLLSLALNLRRTVANIGVERGLSTSNGMSLEGTHPSYFLDTVLERQIPRHKLYRECFSKLFSWSRFFRFTFVPLEGEMSGFTFDLLS